MKIRLSRLLALASAPALLGATMVVAAAAPASAQPKQCFTASMYADYQQLSSLADEYTADGDEDEGLGNTAAADQEFAAASYYRAQADSIIMSCPD